MSAEHSQALQAVHGAVHSSDVGVKYTWFGPGYISNMYYKWIANHPTYRFNQGGDLSFNRGRFLNNSITLASVKARQFSLKSKTMLFDPKCSIFDATSMFRNLEFSKIIIDFNENIRFS